jgi:hypothetical protein
MRFCDAASAMFMRTLTETVGSVGLNLNRTDLENRFEHGIYYVTGSNNNDTDMHCCELCGVEATESCRSQSSLM